MTANELFASFIFLLQLLYLHYMSLSKAINSYVPSAYCSCDNCLSPIVSSLVSKTVKTV